ncbi:lytic transglycosylase domain-containing protein, partial [Dietzia timorensis]
MRRSPLIHNRRTTIGIGVTATVIAGICGTAIVVESNRGDDAPAPEYRQVAEQVTPQPTTESSSETPPPPAEPANLPEGPLGIPGIALKAYQDSAGRLAAEQPACAMDWTLIAGIKKVESNHGNSGEFDVNGNSIKPIFGPRLDGKLSGSAVIKDTDGGKIDGDKEYDRAVGPGQFIPETWERLGRDGNGDGKADPHNIFDSAYSTGNYLCASGGSMEDPAQREAAILSYNNSKAYVQNVNAWAQAYATGIAPDPADLPPIHPEPEPVPEKCPEGTEGEPKSAPETEAPGTPDEKVTVEGCEPVPPPEPEAPPAPEGNEPPPPAPAPSPEPAP